jgi:hypothetical protein
VFVFYLALLSFSDVVNATDGAYINAVVVLIIFINFPLELCLACCRFVVPYVSMHRGGAKNQEKFLAPKGSSGSAHHMSGDRSVEMTANQL